MVSIQDLNEVQTVQYPYLTLTKDGLFFPLVWDHSLPPYLFPERIEATPEHLLALIFHLLENDNKSWTYAKDSELYLHIENHNRLKYGLPYHQVLTLAGTQRELHNIGVIMHYGHVPRDPNLPHPEQAYLQALAKAEDMEVAAFTLRELATFYLDQGQIHQAEAVLLQGKEKVLTEEARQALNLVLVKIWMQQIVVPYDQDHIEKLKQQIWESLNYFEQRNHHVQVGLLLLDATQIANISDSYSEALGYIKRAIDIFESEGLNELAASAQLQKGTLLGTWAQNGNPQFYKPAIEAYQKSLYVFTKEESPDVFADVQHKLGVLYAEMPAENKKRGIWAGISSASFNAALEYYSKERFPYEYASICNNFANAFTKFPPGIRTDNHVKALHYYEEALEIRTRAYPYERAITLLNYLEASWNAGNDPSSFNTARYDDMIAKAEEVQRLVVDADMLHEANRHLENLQYLRTAIEKEQNDA
ncbi:MAG: hypothetical protein AAFR59_11025 [Bacteroidota bacterium]